MVFDTGPRTGTYRTGKDDLLTDKDGNSFISFADYAIAMADEIEAPRHHRERFAVAS
jgi:putative NADH-flavin reductase